MNDSAAAAPVAKPRPFHVCILDVARGYTIDATYDVQDVSPVAPPPEIKYPHDAEEALKAMPSFLKQGREVRPCTHASNSFLSPIIPFCILFSLTARTLFAGHCGDAVSEARSAQGHFRSATPQAHDRLVLQLVRLGGCDRPRIGGLHGAQFHRLHRRRLALLRSNSLRAQEAMPSR